MSELSSGGVRDRQPGVRGLSCVKCQYQSVSAKRICDVVNIPRQSCLLEVSETGNQVFEVVPMSDVSMSQEISHGQHTETKRSSGGVEDGRSDDGSYIAR